jgi:hypothetical protein
MALANQPVAVDSEGGFSGSNQEKKAMRDRRAERQDGQIPITYAFTTRSADSQQVKPCWDDHHLTRSCKFFSLLFNWTGTLTCKSYGLDCCTACYIFSNSIGLELQQQSVTKIMRKGLPDRGSDKKTYHAFQFCNSVVSLATGFQSAFKSPNIFSIVLNDLVCPYL